MGVSNWGNADPMQEQDCKVTESLDLDKREKQKGLWGCIVERAHRLVSIQTLALPLISHGPWKRYVALTGAFSYVRRQC